MIRENVIFDTYAWIEYVKGTTQGADVRQHLEKSNILTPTPVLLELSIKAEKEKWDMQQLNKFIKKNSRIINLNESLVLSFGKLYNNVKRKNKNMGITDVTILALAKQHHAKILTGDPDFRPFKETILLENRHH
jgi:predicted nucleic acid-binding protein